MKESIAERANEVFLPVYKRYPVDVESGEGCYLIDRSGRRYLDLASGLGVNALGYNHPLLISAIENQLHKNLHLSNYFVQDIQIDLMRKLTRSFAEGSRGFFSNSGTEAIEGALKLVKKWGPEHGKHKILAMKGSFHGRTTGAISITMQEKYQKPFQPLLPETLEIEFNSIASLKSRISDDTAAVVLEFIQGEGGVVPVSREFVDTLFELKKNHNFIIVADEIQSGIGRTGKMFSFQHYNVLPDVVCFAKAVGGSLPLGGFLVTEEFANVFGAGEHGTTFGGNPLTCAAGLAVMDYLNEENLRYIQQTSLFLEEKLKEYKKKYNEITETRGIGLMQGLLIPGGVSEIIQKGVEQGLILNSAGNGTVLRFLPPLIITLEELEKAFSILDTIFNELFNK